jgi:hypothetical protein
LDVRFAQAMKNVAIRLLNTHIHQGASMAYCHSDEITIVFPPRRRMLTDGTVVYEPHLFNGHSQKIVSVLASECGVAFYRTCVEQAGLHVNEKDIQAFDGRVIAFAEDDVRSVHRYFYWRSSLECPNYFSSTLARIEKLEADGFRRENFPAAFYHGFVVKKYLQAAVSLETKCSVVQRALSLSPEEEQQQQQPIRVEPATTIAKTVRFEHLDTWDVGLYADRLWTAKQLNEFLECGV